jgi:localization factor PodJL
MAANVPWSVNAVEPDTWATAREAARRSGMSVGEWLEAAIRGSAVEHGMPRPTAHPRGGEQFQHQLNEISERLEYLMQGQSPRGQSTRSDSGEQNKLLHSVDALTDRIDALIGDIRSTDQGTPHQIKTAIDRLDSRLESLFSRTSSTAPSREPEIERKLSEIARGIEMMSRRVEIENSQYVAPQQAPSIAELDSAIAEITVRQAALDDGTYSRNLDRRLASIDTRFGFAPRSDVQLVGLEHQIKNLADEMSALRRSAIQSDSIEVLRREVGDLARMLSDLAPRRSIDALERTVTNLTRRIDRAAFAEKHENVSGVVDALQHIQTALAEVRPAESFSAVERNLHALSSKLDGLNERGVDSDTINRLQTQTSEIRDLLSNALPTDVLKTLVGQIEAMVQRFEHSPSPNEGAVLDVVASLERRIDTFAERVETAARQPTASPALDEIKNRLEQIESALDRGDSGTPGGLEATMKNLVGKLDAAEERLTSIGSLERGLSDLFGQMNEVRASAMEVAERAMRSQPQMPQSPALAPEIYDQRMPAEPSAKMPSPVREQLPNVVHEQTPRIEPAAPVQRASALRAEPRSIALDPETATVSSAQIESDYPLEPGSGSPRVRPGQSASERVALSEAALGGLTTRTPESSSTSNYIAAARRAAQAAAAQQAETTGTKGTKTQTSALTLFSDNKRALMLGFLLVAITFGAVRFGGFGSMIPFLHSNPPALEKRVPTIVPEPAQPEPTKADPEKQSALPTKNDLTLEGSSALELVPPNITPNMLSKPATDPDPTGSIKNSKAVTPAPSVKVATAPSGAGDLPAIIGTTALRNAALAGDPAAAYEIGSRWFDGQGVQANTTEAKRWFEIAQAKGSIPAAYRIGNILEKGTGATKNLIEAQRYYTLAAEGGHTKAMHNLGVLYSEGFDGKPDYKSAARWFRMAADRNIKDSQYNLGVLYARGSGVEANLAESYRWFSLAAAQGDTDAAKKRDDVSKRLDQQTLVAARLAVQTWAPTPTDEGANNPRLNPDWQKAETASPRKRTAKQ